VLAFAGSPQSADWLSKEQAEALLEAISSPEPTA
jgi:hypothetical protein